MQLLFRHEAFDAYLDSQEYVYGALTISKINDLSSYNIVRGAHRETGSRATIG